MSILHYTKHCFTLVTFLVLVALVTVPSAFAQSGVGRLGITLVEVSAFPTVSVHLGITDADGYALTGLEKADFALYENDVPIPDFSVEVAEHPMLIGVVIDSAVTFNTWEGGQARVEHAKEAARWLVDPQYARLTHVDDHVAIFAFEGGQPVRLVDFTYDLQLVLDQGINPVSTEGNQYTALFDILRRAISETATRQGARRRALLVFSDGVDRTSGVEVDRVIQEAVDAHLLIYTVGLGADLAPDRPASAFLRRLADETGGRYMWYQPGRAGEEEEMNAFLDALVAQRAGYMLSYVSNQYEGNPEVRVAAQRAGTEAEDTAIFEVPPLPPVVSIDNLSHGQVLVEVFTIQPSIARTQRAIDRVEYYVDDNLVYTARAAPWIFEWDTREYAASYTEAEAHTLRVVVCDIGQQCSETSLTVGTRLPVPTPTPTPLPTPVIIIGDSGGDGNGTGALQLWISIGALVVALAALVILIIFMRRSGIHTVGGVVAEVRRRTRVWRQRTGIMGGGKPAARRSLATLTVVSDMLKDTQFSLEESVVFLGREEERADIAFYWDQCVSGRHAKISQEGVQLYIWDLNSTNGTWVNEQRVPRSLSEGMQLNEAVALRNGDMIRLGPDLRVRFDLGSEEEPSPPEPAEESASRAESPTQVLKPASPPEPPPMAGKPDLPDTQVSRRR